MKLSSHSPTELNTPTVAVWTPPGRGAVATIRVVGQIGELGHELFRAASRRLLSDLPLNRLCFGQWGREPVEDVVLCRDSVESFEVHCHGGHAAVLRILANLEHVGCRRVGWLTQHEAATSLLEREQAEALSHAMTLRTAAWIAAQSGRLQCESDTLRQLLAEGEWTTCLTRLGDILKWANFGRHLTQPWSVVLAGRPNVGKSSLINALVGYERSIVFDQPGTTRDVVTAETVLDGWPIRFSDTAGQRSSVDDLESSGIARARGALSVADCSVLVIDTSQPPQPEDWSLLSDWPAALIVAHKADLPDRWNDSLPSNAIRVSSLARTGLSELSTAIVRRLIPELPLGDAVLPLSEQQCQTLLALREAALRRDRTAAEEKLRALIGASRSIEEA